MIKHLVQIITACGCHETVEEAAYWTLINGGYVVVVDALWPTLNYPTDPEQISTSTFLKPDQRFEDIGSIIQRHSLNDRFFYLKPTEYMYNGAQYNLALDFIRNNNLPCEHILFHDGDETLDPHFSELIYDHIKTAKTTGASQLRFTTTLEILPGWRALKVEDRIGGNFGFVWGEYLFTRRLEHFDGNFFFENNVPFIGTMVPLYHLHHFRTNAARRISESRTEFFSGGKSYCIKELPEIYETPYVKRLKGRFLDKFNDCLQGETYLGSPDLLGKR